MELMRLMISGGQGGLARAVTETFASNGWLVDAPGRRDLDVSDKAAVEAWFSSCPAYDLVVCNAGVTRDAILLKQDSESWDEVMNANLSGSAWCARCAAQEMRKNKQGHIVFIGSYIAEHPKAGQVLYSSSKAALKALVKTLASEWGRHNIRVNLVYPGFLETSMTAALKPEVKRRAIDNHVLGRLNTPSQTARFLYFLHETMTETSGQLFSLDSRII